MRAPYNPLVILQDDGFSREQERKSKAREAFSQSVYALFRQASKKRACEIVISKELLEFLEIRSLDTLARVYDVPFSLDTQRKDLSAFAYDREGNCIASKALKPPSLSHEAI